MGDGSSLGDYLLKGPRLKSHQTLYKDGTVYKTINLEYIWPT